MLHILNHRGFWQSVFFDENQGLAHNNLLNAANFNHFTSVQWVCHLIWIKNQPPVMDRNLKCDRLTLGVIECLVGF